jgi:hypothetical protein
MPDNTDNPAWHQDARLCTREATPLDVFPAQYFYRASALGHCLHALDLSRLGHEESPPPAKLQQVYDLGHATEDFTIEHLILEGHFISQRQAEVILHCYDNYNLRGHVEGIVVPPWNEDSHVLEIKSLRDNDAVDAWTPDYFDTKPLWMGYTWQFDTYMTALTMPMLLVVASREDPTYFREHIIEQPFHTRDQINARVALIPGAACLETNHYGCPFWKECDVPTEAELDRAFDVGVHDDNLELRAAVEQLKKARSFTKAGKLGEEAAKKMIRDIVGAEYEGDYLKVTTTTVPAHMVKESTRTTITPTKGRA